MALIVHPTAGKDLDNDNAYMAADSAPTRSNFVGLSNQGATCYMNSLLQTLFMTPEFRRAIYSWKYDKEKDGPEEDCIPFQLQRLFGMLQLSTQRAVETRSLTKSFGWDGQQAFEQHDVQELCRVLFDALDVAFKGTQYENLIDRLYGGNMVDYIKCRDVNYQSERKDKFLDLSLVIRPFGSNKIMHSLDECLQYFLKPEILDGENQYFCEDVKKKVDAIKGLKFESLPYILTIQLKRFDYDPRTFNRIKLNDQVRFPLVLNLDKYMSHKNGAAAEGEEDFEQKLQAEVEKLWNHAKSMEEGESTEGADEDLAPEDCPGMPDLVDINGTISQDQKEEQETKYAEDEPVDVDVLLADGHEWVYELYAVLIHSGSALGGHYYAYIRNLDTNKWHNFNDSSVSDIDRDMIKVAWGGKSSSGYYNQAYQSGANAYMLMYRKIDRTKNETLPGEDAIPEYLKADVVRIAEEEKRKQQQRVEEMNQINLFIFHGDKELKFSASKDENYIDLLRRAVTEFKVPPKEIEGGATNGAETAKPTETDHNEDEDHLEAPPAEENIATKLVTMDCVRLRNYSKYFQTAQEVYDVETDGKKTLNDIGITNYKVLCIETRTPDEEWPVYDINAENLTIIEYNAKEDQFEASQTLRISKTATLADLKANVRKMMKNPTEKIAIMKLQLVNNTDAKVELLQGDEDRFRDKFHVYGCTKLHVEPITTPGTYRSLDKFISNHNTINLKLVLSSAATQPEVAVEADKRWTIEKLRTVIGQKFNIPADDFRMRRQYPNGIELKDPSQTLEKANLITLHIEHGKPLPEGHYYVRLYQLSGEIMTAVKVLDPVSDEELTAFAKRYIQYTPSSNSPSNAATEAAAAQTESKEETTPSDDATESNFGELRALEMCSIADFEFLMKVVTASRARVADLRRDVVEKLKEIGKLAQNASVFQVRIREKLANRATRFLREDLTLQENSVSVFDGRELTVQLLDQAEILPPFQTGDTIFRVVRWHRSTWTMSEPHFIYLRGSDSLRAISIQLGNFFDIDPLHLQAVLVNQYQFADLFLADLDKPAPRTNLWLRPCAETRLLKFMQFYPADGDALIIQDTSEPLRELTPAEKASLEKRKTTSSTSYSYSTTSSWVSTSKYSRKEQGIKIKTHEDRIREAKERDTSITDTTDTEEPTSTATETKEGDDTFDIYSDVEPSAQNDREAANNDDPALFADLT